MEKYLYTLLIFAIGIFSSYGQNSDVISVNRNIGYSNTIKYSDIEKIQILHNNSSHPIQIIKLKSGKDIEVPIEEIDSVVFNKEAIRDSPIFFFNLPMGWSTMSYIQSNNFLCYKNDNNGNHLLAKGFNDNVNINILYDNISRLKRYYDGNVSFSFDYSAFDQDMRNPINVYYENHVNHSFFPFTIELNKDERISRKADLLSSQNQQLNSQILSSLINEVVDILTEPLNILIKPIETFKLLYDTDNLNYYEQIDYILNEEYQIIPTDWIDGFLERIDNTPTPEVYPSFFIGVRTGGNNNVTTNSVDLSIEGTIQANANDGEFSFEYGIVYSTNSNVDCYNGVHLSTHCNSSLCSSISVALPRSYHATGLMSNTKYYYRAFWRNNDDLAMVDYGDVKTFTTKKDDNLIYGTWNCVWTETPPNAKLLTMTINKNGTLTQTYYYANKGKNITYSHPYSYENGCLTIFKNNGDTQVWSVTNLSENTLTIVAKTNGFTYNFIRVH